MLGVPDNDGCVLASREGGRDGDALGSWLGSADTEGLLLGWIEGKSDSDGTLLGRRLGLADSEGRMLGCWEGTSERDGVSLG